MIRFLGGDCREILKTLSDKSVQCVVTSPPYFGLRDYGTAEWSGGSVPDCDHVVGAIRTGLGLEKLGERYRGGGHKAAEPKPLMATGVCPKCGAVRVDSQIGIEPTPALYVAEMVAVFRGIRRVLRDDGTVWLNLGDSYCSTAPGTRNAPQSKGSVTNADQWANMRPKTPPGMKPKDLMMIPARVAIALCDDGWYLRKNIIWAKPNPMPESCEDRPTSSHEHVFLLTKRPRYFYDAEAVREDCSETSHGGPNIAPGAKNSVLGKGHASNGLGKWDAADKTLGRNLRDVWTIATSPYPDAHFAVMPAELAETCIKAGTSEKGACPVCGTPWARIVQKTRTRDGQPLAGSFNTGDGHKIGASGVGHWRDTTKSETTGWCQTCDCPPADPRPCVVLDPFSGAGTTALVADRLGRDAIGIDLNPTYGEMARDRLIKDAGMFAVFG